jgi:hypothetical protein
VFDNCAMLASAWKGQSFSSQNKIRYGLRVGRQNRDDYFERWPSVFVDFDNRTIEVTLLPGFWERCPELRHDISLANGSKNLDYCPGLRVTRLNSNSFASLILVSN